MAVSKAPFAKEIFDNVGSMGDKIMGSDAQLVFEGYEEFALQIQGFPMPVYTPGEGAEVPMPMGLVRWQPTQGAIHQQGGITLQETVTGVTFKALAQILNNAGGVHRKAKIYEGTKDRFLRFYPIYESYITLESGERNWESRTQVLNLTGTLYYHYFGEIVTGGASNITDAYAGLKR